MSFKKKIRPTNLYLYCLFEKWLEYSNLQARRLGMTSDFGSWMLTPIHMLEGEPAAYKAAYDESLNTVEEIERRMKELYPQAAEYCKRVTGCILIKPDFLFN